MLVWSGFVMNHLTLIIEVEPKTAPLSFKVTTQH